MKIQAEEKLTQLSKLYTEPSEMLEAPPHHKYTLRGVCAQPHTVYVKERSRLHTNGEVSDGNAEDEPWWKLSFMANASPSNSSSVGFFQHLNKDFHSRIRSRVA